MASLKDYMYQRASVGAPKGNLGGEPPSKGGPTNGPSPFAAPAPSLKIPEKPAETKTTPFKTDPSYNYHAAVKQVKTEGGSSTALLKAKRKDFGKQFDAGIIKSRGELKDSIQSTMPPGVTRREIRQETKNVAGRTGVGQVIHQGARAVKKAFRSKGKLTMKAECRSRSCSQPGKGF